MVGGRLNGSVDAPDALDKADLREAYERGRRDERARRKRHPVLMTLTFVCAAIGLVLLALAAVNGSFSRGGGVVDDHLRIAATQAQPAVREAASNAGRQLQDVGQSVKTRASDSAG